MTKLHASTFGAAPLDAERDASLSLRLRALSFVEPAHLDMPPGAVDERAVGLAGRELLKVNQFKVNNWGERERGHGSGKWRAGVGGCGAFLTLTPFLRPPATSLSASSTAAAS